jgi:hypothetical protein
MSVLLLNFALLQQMCVDEVLSQKCSLGLEIESSWKLVSPQFCIEPRLSNLRFLPLAILRRKRQGTG